MHYKPIIISLYEIGAVKFGDFTLKSGKQSKIYLDLRMIISYPDVLRGVSEAIWQQINGYKFDLICGVPYTALPIATCISLHHDSPMVMRRKEKKEYGTRQMVEGKYQLGQTCVIIEDLATTGSSIIETADDLEIAGLKVREVAVLIDREEGAKDNLHARHYHLNAAFTLSDMLKVLLHVDEVSENDKAIINSLIEERA